MTLKINMLPDESASGGLGIGVMTSAGNPWSVPDALANELVNRRVATYAVAPFNDDGSLGAEEVFKVRGVVSGAGVANGTMLAEVTPNTLLTDTDTTMRQLGFVTIAGGKLTARTRLEIAAIIDATGNDSKTLQLRAGPFSGSFATATAFGGLSGFTTQKYIGLVSLLWGDNSTTAQRVQPSGQNLWGGNNTANPSAALAIDTGLDWNIYVGWQSSLAGGAPTNGATLRNLWVRVVG